MADPASVQNTLALAALLFAVGMVGFVARRNLAAMILSGGIMSQGIVLTAVAFGTLHANPAGQALAAFALTIMILQVVCAVSVTVYLARQRRTLDPSVWSELGLAPADDVESVAAPQNAKVSSDLQVVEPVGSLPRP